MKKNNEKKYELWKFADGYSVVWFDEAGIEMAKDREDGVEYPVSEWITAPNFVGYYSSEKAAWIASMIDALCNTEGDPRLHPRYSYKYKCIV